MKSVTVTGGCDLSAATRGYLHDRVGELQAEHPMLRDVELVVKPSGDGFEVVMKGSLPRHGHCESKGTGDKLHDAVNAAVDHFETQLRKKEGRLKNHRTAGVKNTEARLAEADED